MTVDTPLPSDSDKSFSGLSYKSDRASDGNDSDNDSSDGGSPSGDLDSDITKLSEKEARQVLNNEVIFFIYVL